MRPLLVILLALVLAGCASPDADPAPAPAADEPLAEGAVAPGAGEVADAAAPPPVEQLIAFEGTIPQYVEACAVAQGRGQCLDVPPTADFSRMRHELTPQGAVVSLHLTATWTATNPRNADLVMFVGGVSEDRSQYVGIGWKMGPSPLDWDVADAKALPPGYTLRIGLGAPSTGSSTPAGTAWASSSPTEQPFAIEGHLVTQP